MAWTFALVAMLLVQTCIPPAAGYGESDATGHPNYQERANHVFANAVRIAPSQYKTVYMAGYSPSPASILGSSYPAVPPMYLEPRLVSAAFSHSQDMAINNCFSHNNCNGTATFTRIKSFYSCSGGMGENIAAGNADPLDANNQWLCDETGGACAADKSGGDGHRSNIMATYKAVGTGYAYSSASTYRHYWTQDFGGAPCSPAPTSPVYGGSHRVKSGNTLFIAVYWTVPAVAPSSASVVVGGVTYPLAFDIGAPGAGTYQFSQVSGTGCRSYYFQFGNVRYPETGCLVTYGEGTCTASFDGTCSGNGPVAVATTAAATTAAATTAAATTTTATTAAATTAAATTAAATTSTISRATTVAATTAAAVTTAAAATTATATTGTSGIYYLYSGSLMNGWRTVFNGGQIPMVSYLGRTALTARLTLGGSTNFVMLDRTPGVTNVWNAVQFKIATSVNTNILIYFNGGYYQSKPITSSWQSLSIPMSALANPQTGTKYATIGGGKSLVFQGTNVAVTLYLADVAFV